MSTSKNFYYDEYGHLVVDGIDFYYFTYDFLITALGGVEFKEKEWNCYHVRDGGPDGKHVDCASTETNVSSGGLRT